MENKAHYALIGTFVLIALFAIIAFIAWLSNAQFDQQFDEYEVSFQGGVQGLSQGTEVRFNGLKVGDVTRLRIDPNDTNAVLVDIQVQRDTPVDTKSIGRMEPLGLTGLNYIQIIPGGAGFPLIKELPGKGPYRLVGEASRIDILLGGLVAIEKAATDVSTAALAVDVTAKDFDTLVQNDVKSVLARAEVSMAELDKALGSIGTAADGTGALITDGRDAINRLSNSGLTDMEETIDGIRRVVESLARVADSLEQNPAAFIAGTEKETVELPQ